MNKYRKLPWNQKKVQHLLDLARVDKIGHAYLFHGQRGIGKLDALMEFAGQLFCQQAQEGESCGQCQGCRLFAAGSHPDFRMLRLEEEARQIKIEQVRESQSFIANTPMMGRHKLLLIEPAELLNINAANALLKNLEEPAAGTLFFLVSHQPGSLLATIRSRCQQIKFPRPEKQQSLEFLQQTLSAEQAEAALEMTNGAPLAALKFASEEGMQEISAVHESLLSLLQGEMNITDAASDWMAMDENLLLETLLTATEILLKGLLRDKTSSATNRHWQSLQELQSLLEAKHVRSLHFFYQDLLNTRAMLRSRANPNKQLLLEALCLEWVRPFRDNTERWKRIA